MFKQYDGRKAATLVAAVFSVLAIIFLALLFYINQRVKIIDVSECDTSDTGSITYSIEEIGAFYNYISINGYAYQAGEDMKYADIKVLAHDSTTDTYFELPSENVKREDITNQMNDGFNYDYSGFKSVVYKDKIPEDCSICLLYRCNDKNILVDTTKE